MNLRSLGRAVRMATRIFRNMAWDLKNGKMTDRERFAMRLARMHIRDGRPDLAAEDMAWMVS